MGLTLFIYNLILLLAAVIGAPVWLVYLALIPKGRAGFWEKLGLYSSSFRQRVEVSSESFAKKRIWLHAVSVGEFNALKPLISDLQDEFILIVSTTTRTGHALAVKTYPHLPVLYFPYDFCFSICRALQLIRPDLVIIAETELWPNFIDNVTRVFKTPLFLINGRISQHSFEGYRSIKLLIKPALRQITHLFMQSQGDADRIQSLGDLSPEQLTVVGNIKFDILPATDVMKCNMLRHLLSFDANHPVLVFASTHSGEEKPLLEEYMALKKDFPELKLVLAPRHPERVAEIKAILNAKAAYYSLRSQLTEENPNRQDIVVLDTIGELITIYSLSTVAIMGGSFIERGGQNPIEPLSQQIPVIFGPHMSNFTEISRLILENEAGFQVQKPEDLIHISTQLLTQPELYQCIVQNGQRLLENNRGTKEIISQHIRAILNH